MSKGQHREQLRAMRDAEATKSELLRVRHPHEHVSYPGAGAPLVRIIRRESFKHLVCWEAREIADELVLFGSRSPVPDEYSLVGEHRLSSSTEDVRNIVEGLRSFDLPIFPPMGRFAMLDGATVEVILNAGWQTRVALSWSEGAHPAEWNAFVLHVDALIAALCVEFPA